MVGIYGSLFYGNYQSNNYHIVVVLHCDKKFKHNCNYNCCCYYCYYYCYIIIIIIINFNFIFLIIYIYIYIYIYIHTYSIYSQEIVFGVCSQKS